jgi:hypothetical protein
MFQNQMTIFENYEIVPKWLFYIFDFGTYQLIVPALILKALKKIKGQRRVQTAEFSGS